MRRAIFRQHGAPVKVIELIEEARPRKPGPKEVRVRKQVDDNQPC